MGIRSFAVVAALAATQLALVSACGWANERCCGNTCKVAGLECKGGWCRADDGCGGDGQECCDIHPNDPNRGTCDKPNELVCWEGECGRCGMNGKMACPGGVCLDDCLEVNDEGWCSEIPSCRDPEFSPCEEACGDGEMCKWGRCIQCGGAYQPPCEAGCNDGFVPRDEDDLCEPDESAGPPPCEPACGDGEVCKWNRCHQCGGLWETPCEDGCDGLLSVRESDDICAPPEISDVCNNGRIRNHDIDSHDLPGSGGYQKDLGWCNKACLRNKNGCNAVVYHNRTCYLKKLDTNSPVQMVPRPGYVPYVFCDADAMRRRKGLIP